MIDLIEADAPEVFVTATKIPTVESYLYALGRACIEAAGNPRVPVAVRVAPARAEDYRAVRPRTKALTA